MSERDQSKLIVVPQRMYDDLKKAGMEIGCVPQQRLPFESFSEYVKRYPKAS